ncbi:MAG: thioredoxin domain-containing protein, partial [Candidatus Omnitrophica bacterium]|nr:thioredoxin domain-containing protein [Candidatus Omnitrophota bacterium]
MTTTRRWVGLGVAGLLIASGVVGCRQDPAAPSAADTQGRRPNRLIREKSPYLLQHAYNPVDWYPWGEAAFAKAKKEDKPIFLSVGYSTCYWCHVMEKESFENPEVARIMNETVVAIKVDREERPDIDAIYMTAVQAMTGQGGWPLTVILTPDLQPFFGGTYFPKERRGGLPGMTELLPAIAQAWRAKRSEVTQSAEQLTGLLRQSLAATKPGALGVDVLERAVGQAVNAFDPTWGGFGGAPKFPRSHELSFLLTAWARSGSDDALTVVTTTLDRLIRGGIRDHLGGGFHRYSTDARWLVPHFEKMLYDQALIARTLLEAFQVTGTGAFAEAARETFDYVLRDLAHPEGGFYTAEDADSEGEEGKF